MELNRNQASARYADSSYGTGEGEYVDKDLQATHQRLAELKRQKEEYESARNHLNAIQTQKSNFSEAQNSLGKSMYDAGQQIQQDIATMSAEVEALRTIQDVIAKSLRLLATIQPEDWTMENTESQILRGREVMEQCEMEFAESARKTSRMKHIKPISATRKALRFKMTGKEFTFQFLQGLSFHLSLLIVGAILLALYSIFFNQ